jgi:hypothetical protein
VQLYRYFVSQSSEFCRHNPLCYFSTSVYCCLFRYGLSPQTFGYILIHSKRTDRSLPNILRYLAHRVLASTDKTQYLNFYSCKPLQVTIVLLATADQSGCRSLQGYWDIHLRYYVQNRLGPSQLNFHEVPLATFPEVKWLEREVGHSPHPPAKVYNTWSLTATFPARSLMAKRLGTEATLLYLSWTRLFICLLLKLVAPV